MSHQYPENMKEVLQEMQKKHEGSKHFKQKVNFLASARGVRLGSAAFLVGTIALGAGAFTSLIAMGVLGMSLMAGARLHIPRYLPKLTSKKGRVLVAAATTVAGLSGLHFAESKYGERIENHINKTTKPLVEIFSKAQNTKPTAKVDAPKIVIPAPK